MTPTHRSATPAMAVLLALTAAACQGSKAAPPATSIASVPVVSSPSSVPSADPETLPKGVLASIPLQQGVAPGAVGMGFGSVWVATHRGTILYRIDPTSNSVIAQIDIGQESCYMPMSGFGRVWTTPCDSSTKMIVVDPGTNQVVGSAEGSGPIAFVGGVVWAPDYETCTSLRQIDPHSLKVVGSVKVHGCYGVFGDGSIWVADVNPSGSYSGTISKVDPATNRVVGTLHTPRTGPYPDIAYDFGALWLKGYLNGKLLRVDPVSGSTKTYVLPGFHTLYSLYDVTIARGLGSLWMRTADGTVSRFDPATGKVTATYPTDPAGDGGGVAFGFGSLWTANFDTGNVWRIRVGD